MEISTCHYIFAMVNCMIIIYNNAIIIIAITIAVFRVILKREKHEKYVIIGTTLLGLQVHLILSRIFLK